MCPACALHPAFCRAEGVSDAAQPHDAFLEQGYAYDGGEAAESDVDDVVVAAIYGREPYSY